MIKTGEGYTATEKYLKSLCEGSFLSLWSYTNVFRQPGSELCDLLVIVGDEIIIFSDKNCQFSDSVDIKLGWQRWFRRAIIDSAKQLWGARNWITKYSDRIYLDSQCLQKLPIPIRISDKTRIHLVLVAHGASRICREKLGGSGSMMYNGEIVGFEQHKNPFMIGDLDSNRTFIHVIDDSTLDILLKTRNTITDFTGYLIKREKLLRGPVKVFSTGEEEMLAHYLTALNDENEHDFVLPKAHGPISDVVFQEGTWDSFQNASQRIAQLKADEISYFWDELIEKFSYHAITGTQYKVSEGGFLDSEKAIRFMALENRFTRRILAQGFLGMIHKTPRHMRMLRVVPINHDNLYYAFLLFPSQKHFPNMTYDAYRVTRGNFLEAVCFVVRLVNPDAKYVIGIAMDTGSENSEDLLVFDCSSWSQELEQQARKDQEELRILTSYKKIDNSAKEYPDVK